MSSASASTVGGETGDVGWVVGEAFPVFRVAVRGDGVVAVLVGGGGAGAGSVSWVAGSKVVGDIRGETCGDISWVAGGKMASSVTGLVESCDGCVDGAGEGIVVRPWMPRSLEVT